jgi:hypothetical protein
MHSMEHDHSSYPHIIFQLLLIHWVNVQSKKFMSKFYTDRLMCNLFLMGKANNSIFKIKRNIYLYYSFIYFAFRKTRLPHTLVYYSTKVSCFHLLHHLANAWNIHPSLYLHTKITWKLWSPITHLFLWPTLIHSKSIINFSFGILSNWKILKLCKTLNLKTLLNL